MDNQLADLFMEYLCDFITQGGSQLTFENYRRQFKLLLRSWPEVSLANFEDPNFLLYLESKLPAGWKVSTRKSCIREIGFFANWLARVHHIGQRRQLPRISRRPKSRAIPTDEEITLIKSSLAARAANATGMTGQLYTKDYLIVCLLIETGARISEALWIQTRQLHLEEMPPHIIIEEGKTYAANRAIEISPSLAREIKAYRMKYGIAQGLLFRSRTGKPLQRTTFTAWLKRYCKELGVKCSTTPHIFRHRFALKTIMEGKSAIEVMTRLGHEDVAMTVYYFNQVRRLYPMIPINGDVAILEKTQRFWRENTNTRRNRQ